LFVFMKNMKILLASVVLMALTAVSVFAKNFEVIQPIIPDAQSAVVYFIGSKYGIIFDGTTPVGDFTKLKKNTNLAYKTTPGEHYFAYGALMGVMSVIKADLQANKRYYVKVDYVPVPYAPLYIMNILEPAEGAASLENKKLQTVQFLDEWRDAFSQKKLNANLAKKAEENTQEAKNGTREVKLLSGANGH